MHIFPETSCGENQKGLEGGGGRIRGSILWNFEFEPSLLLCRYSNKQGFKTILVYIIIVVMLFILRFDFNFDYSSFQVKLNPILRLC